MVVTNAIKPQRLEPLQFPTKDRSDSRVRLILCWDSGPVRIEGLTITNGLAVNDPAAGGIYAARNSHPIVSGCIISNNSGGVGAGINAANGATIVDSQILNNSSSYVSAAGAGIVCGDCEVTRCVIRGNTCSGDPGCLGAGIAAANARITDCWIEGNIATGNVSAAGGGICARGGTTIERCTFLNNSSYAAFTNSGGWGGAVYAVVPTADLGPVAITECIFVGNSATFGAAIVSEPGKTILPVEVMSCTLVGNDGGGGVGGIYLDNGAVNSTIIAMNEGYATNGSAVFSCTSIYGNTLGDEIVGVDGGGNISLDPQFCAVDPVQSLRFTLQEDSPCAPGNEPNISCGLMGAAPVDCGIVAIKKSDWGEVKSLFRR